MTLFSILGLLGRLYGFSPVVDISTRVYTRFAIAHAKNVGQARYSKKCPSARSPSSVTLCTVRCVASEQLITYEWSKNSCSKSGYNSLSVVAKMRWTVANG